MTSVIEIKCPGCGAPVSTETKECEYCHRPIVISTFNNVAGMPLPELNKYTKSYEATLKEHPENSEINMSVAFCYLKLNIYEKALEYFLKTVEGDFSNSEAYFYAAICVLAGRKPFVVMRPEIDKIQEYINAAISIEPKGIYYYFLAFIKHDYFKRKFLKTSPTYQEALQLAHSTGYSENDTTELFSILKIEKPNGF